MKKPSIFFTAPNVAEVLETAVPVSDAPAVYTRLAAGGPFPIVQFDWTI